MEEKKFHKIWENLTNEELAWIYKTCGGAPDPDKILHGLYTHDLFRSKAELFWWIIRQDKRQHTHPKKSKTISLEQVAETQERQQRLEELNDGNS